MAIFRIVAASGAVIAVGLSGGVGLLRDVHTVPFDASFGGSCHGGEDAHEGRLAGTVGAQEAEHAGRKLEREIIQAALTAPVFFADFLDGELHRGDGAL